MKQRTIAKTIKQSAKSFPVILVTGPRQVGKTTALEKYIGQNVNYVSLDNLSDRELAINDPDLFLKKYQTPLIIDEIQYAPELFTYIKIYVDKVKKAGMYYLTGSQKFSLMQNISESLAGRVAIIDLLGFSKAEKENRANSNLPFLPNLEYLKTDSDIYKNIKPISIDKLYKDIWYGSFPALLSDKNISRDIFFNSYLQTYIQRDVKKLLNVSNELSFTKFIRTIAARTGQIINYSDIARDVDVDQKTIKSWLSILQASGLIYLLYPYHANTTKRIIKSPKIYFLDSGLCCYLTNWSSPEALESGSMSGAILETYIFTEILKSYWHNGKNPYIHYYRDSNKREIDLLIEQDNMLYPIEFKKTSMPGRNAGKYFSVLDSLNKNIAISAIICLVDKPSFISKDIIALPVNIL